MIIRSYTPADAAAVAELSNELSIHTGGHTSTTATALSEVVSAVVRQIDTDTRLVFAPDGMLVAYGMVPTPPGAGSVVMLLGGVRPGWHGRGLGREMLGWQLARGHEIHQASGARRAWEVLVTVPLGDTGTARLLRRFALAPARYGLKMTAATTAGEVAAVPEGVRVETYTPGYEVALHATHTEAFTGQWGFQPRELAQWEALTVRSTSFLPEFSWLAFAGESLVGYLLTYESSTPELLYVGQVGVIRSWRRQGLAGAMLSRMLAAGHRAGRGGAELDVDAASPTGAVGVYERVGFTVKSRLAAYTVELPAPPDDL